METVSPPADLSGHVLICHINEKVAQIVEELQFGSGRDPSDIVCLVHDEDLWRAHPQWHPRRTLPGPFFLVFGHPTDDGVLHNACAPQATAHQEYDCW